MNQLEDFAIGKIAGGANNAYVGALVQYGGTRPVGLGTGLAL